MGTKQMMQAYRLLNWQTAPQVVEVEVPRPGSNEILIKVAGNGLCHSDFTMQQIPESYATMLGWHVPFTLGHEIGGWVEECGAGVEDLAPGDPVVLVSLNSCGKCKYCLRGQDNACPQSVLGRGYGRDGGLASYVIANNTREVIKLQGLDPITSGPLTDAGATSYHAVKRALSKLPPGSTAVVIGAGGLGSFAIQHLRVLSSARIIAIDVNQARLDFARDLGASDILLSSPTVKSDALELTHGQGAEAVFDFVGTDATLETGIGVLAKAGIFALIGAGFGTLNQPWYMALPQEAEIFRTQGGTVSDVREVVALAEAGRIHNEVELFTFDRLAEAYQKLEQGQLRGRAVITPAH